VALDSESGEGSSNGSVSSGDAVSKSSNLQAESLLINLDPQQREAATAIRGPVAIIAGAGTGKTRAITHRIAYAIESGVMDPNRVLALTFTAKAAAQLRNRLRGLGQPNVQAHTFHSAAWRQLTFFWKEAIGGPLPKILNSKYEILSEIAREEGLSGKPAFIRELSDEIEWAKGKQIHHDDFISMASERTLSSGLTVDAMAGIYALYDQRRQSRGLVDFEDILLFVSAILEERTSIVDRVRDQYRYFTVDEYQDVSSLQQRVLDLWLGKRKEICVVGDPSQNIYSFAGSTAQYLNGFSQKYPEAKVLRLTNNYRSTPHIIHLANSIEDRELSAARNATAKAHRAPQLTEYRDEQQEVETISHQISDLISSGVRPRDIAILLRRNDQVQEFERVLTLAGTPVVLAGKRPFFALPEIREAIRLLRGAALASSGKKVTPAENAKQMKVGSKISDHQPLFTAISEVLTSIGWSPSSAKGDDPRLLLYELAYDLVQDAPDADLRTFVDEFDNRERDAVEPLAIGVTITSLHTAKGLEWDYVFLPALREGVLPISQSTSSTLSDEAGLAAVAEERRLFYVGVTRAKDEIYLSFTGTPSRFLAGLPLK
jgi:DNA helicase-2/ATP-dependent DNA helicase PcrA